MQTLSRIIAAIKDSEKIEFLEKYKLKPPFNKNEKITFCC